MGWDVQFTEEFEAWWNSLDEGEQEAVAAKVGMLEERGPTLDDPHTSQVHQSRHGNMRELKIQYKGQPYRVLYAFDPRRVCMLLLGGNKTGDSRWYDRNVPTADRIYETLLKELEEEGEIK